MAKKEEEKIITGLETASDRKEAEYDIVAALLEAAAYKNEYTPVDIKRNGKFLFTVNIRPLSDDEVKALRKRATVYMKNPENKKLPPIQKDFNSGMFNSLLIYAATSEEDKAQIWGNKQIMNKYNLVEPYESVDVLLTVGEKTWLSDVVVDICGMDSDEEVEVTKEEYTKN